MIDTEAARERVMSQVPDVDSTIIDAFHNYLRGHNAFVKGYLTMKEMKAEEERAARVTNQTPRELKLLFSMDAQVYIAGVYAESYLLCVYRHLPEGSTEYRE